MLSFFLFPRLYFFFVTDTEVTLNRLNKIWYKLPGLRSYEAFKKYEDLFQMVDDGHIEVRRLRISENLQQRINWLYRLSKSSAADLWKDDASIEKAVLKIFEDLNKMLEKEYKEPRVHKLMEFKKEMNNW
ncbi:MAG: hypothetical protein HDS11_04045 [Bacteroides sp.]|nr:hypothetical protein [Bacteroides sp.]